MAKAPGLKLTQEEVSQTIDLSEEFGVDLSRNESLKARIGQAIIDRMVERTESGKSINGSNLKRPYSESYSKSAKFEIYGKSKNNVNMKLTGDMLSSVDLEDSLGSELKIAVRESQAAKAYNHNVGDTVPKRPWFGVNKSDLKAIKREFSDELRDIKEGKKEIEERQEQTKVDLATIRALGGSVPAVEERMDSLFGSLFGFRDGEDQV